MTQQPDRGAAPGTPGPRDRGPDGSGRDERAGGGRRDAPATGTRQAQRPPAPEEAEGVVDASDQADAAPGAVVRVLRPGYGDGERQLRPAAVVVARQRE